MKCLFFLFLLSLAMSAGAQDGELATEATAASGVVPGIKLQPEDKVGRTYSEGSPFQIWGGNRAQRSSLFTAAGVVRRSVLEALHLPDTWSFPIIMQIRELRGTRGPQGPPVWTAISQVEGGFRLEINLVPRRDTIPGPLLRESLVRAVLADRILQGKQQLDLRGAPSPPPDWLLHGTLALMDYREFGRASLTFSRIFRLGRVLSVPEILNAEPTGMDSVSMTLYEVSCGALVMMLLEQPKGPEHFARLLPSLAYAATGHDELIEQAFPGLGGSANSLSKWWSLQIAALSQPGLEEVMAPAETERELAEALVLRYVQTTAPEKRPGPVKRWLNRGKPPEEPAQPVVATQQTCPITDYPKILALPEPGGVFNQTELALTRLMLRAHPVYRPIIKEYQDAVRQLAKGNTAKNLPATLGRLATTREKLAATIQGIEDQLDWYEATQSSQSSGAFEGYLKAAEGSEQPRHTRQDALSHYLDEVEAELGP